MGFSLGVLPAQKLARTRSGARGAVLMYACVPVSYFGAGPAGLPVHVHGMADGPHYFADSSLPAYDAEAAGLLRRRVLDFLRARVVTLQA